MKSILVTMLMVLSLAGRLSALGESDWAWHLYPSAGYGSRFGVNTSALDGTDSQDQLSPLYYTSYLAARHDNGVDGWTGDSGFYSSDFRSPLAPGQSKTWTFYLWARPGYSSDYLYMSWEAPIRPAFDTTEYRLTYVRAADGITGEDVSLGTSISLINYPQWGWRFPVYKTTNGLTGYEFQLTATMTPEPSSLLALGGGLAAIGLLRRRRKQ